MPRHFDQAGSRIRTHALSVRRHSRARLSHHLMNMVSLLPSPSLPSPVPLLSFPFLPPSHCVVELSDLSFCDAEKEMARRPGQGVETRGGWKTTLQHIVGLPAAVPAAAAPAPASEPGGGGGGVESVPHVPLKVIEDRSKTVKVSRLFASSHRVFHFARHSTPSLHGRGRGQHSTGSTACVTRLDNKQQPRA